MLVENYFGMSTSGLAHVTDEFLKQNSKHVKTKKRSRRKGGPHTKIDKFKRREEVYRLHFEYGYSARKIAELMKVSRNTVNGDIDFMYSNVLDDGRKLEPEDHIMTALEVMRIQISRLREQLDKTKSTSERITIERLMYDINSKIIYTWQKIALATTTSLKLGTKWYNETMEKKNMPDRVMLFYDTITVSDKARKKIHKVIDEDRKHRASKYWS